MTTGTTPGTTTTRTTEATEATTEATAERPHAGRFGPVSVRTRLTVVIALLTLVAMTVAGVLVYALESRRIELAVTEQIKQEIGEFRLLEREGVDPETAEPFTNAQSLLVTFLLRNVPDDDEMLVVYREGEPRDRSPTRYGAAFLDDPDFQDATARLLGSGGTERVQDSQYGEVWVTALEVRNRSTEGHLVILNFLDDEHSELRRTLQTYTIVALLSLGLITLLASRTSGRLLAPLRVVRQTAREITTSDLSRRIPERGNDDVSALTRTFNDMLDRLEDGVESQRRFLDDAGHELRTPLTVLGGHLELLDPHSPDEVARTRALLLDEVDRMSRLVRDLILLAKSRRPDFVRLRPVDLAALTTSLMAKAEALGDRAWVLESTGDGVAWIDEQRITQALLQLADNAVKHTDTGTRIALGSAREAEVVRLWVHDAGPGVRPEDRERIFERFGRGVVRPGDEGFGLGLSIVRAIVDAHGGSLTVRDGVPHGALFEIVVPTRSSEWPTS